MKDFAYWRAASVGARTAADPAERAWFDTDRQRREKLVIRDLGVWSHYVGDASQPMHVSMHFDGWGPFDNPRGFSTKRGLHAQFEGAFVKTNVKRDAVKAAIAPYRACTCSIWDRMRSLILASQAEVVPLYELEQKGAFIDGNTAGIAFATARLAEFGVGAARHDRRCLAGERGHGRRLSGDPGARHRGRQAHPHARRFRPRLTSIGAGRGL